VQTPSHRVHRTKQTVECRPGIPTILWPCTIGVRRKFSWGGFVQWHIVVIFIWCGLFVTSQFDVVFMFPSKVLATFVDTICIFFHAHSPYFICYCTSSFVWRCPSELHALFIAEGAHNHDTWITADEAQWSAGKRTRYNSVIQRVIAQSAENCTNRTPASQLWGQLFTERANRPPLLLHWI